MHDINRAYMWGHEHVHKIVEVRGEYVMLYITYTEISLK